MTNQYFLARLAGRDPNLRAGDADRERIAERLRKGHAEGRLDTAEFQQRIDRCYESKTFGELGQLVSDLPREDHAERRPSAWFRPWRLRWIPLWPIVIALLVLSAATGEHHAGWLWIPLVFLFMRVFWWRRRRWFAGARHSPDDWI